MRLETKKFVSRFTEEAVEVVRFTGSQEHLMDIMDWVIDNKGRAQANIRTDQGLDLMVHERGVGLVKVKPGENVVKMPDGSFEIIPVLAFSQTYKRVSPITKVALRPVILESMQFTGGAENEEELEEWLNANGYKGVFKHSIPGTTIIYYRVKKATGEETIDIPLNDWVVIANKKLFNLTPEKYHETYQKVE